MDGGIVVIFLVVVCFLVYLVLAVVIADAFVTLGMYAIYVF